MITWLNGKPVFAVMSHNFEGLTLQLNRFNNKTKELEFIDKIGTKHYTDKDYVEFIYPDDIDSKKLKKISDAMKFGKDDIYENN